MVLDYNQLIAQQMIAQQSRLVSEVQAEQDKAREQRESVMTSSSSQLIGTGSTSSKSVSGYDYAIEKREAKIDKLENTIDRLQDKIRSGKGDAEDSRRLRDSVVLREELMQEVRDIKKTESVMSRPSQAGDVVIKPIETKSSVPTPTTPTYSPSLSQGSNTQTVGLFYEVEPTKGVPETTPQTVYAFNQQQVFAPTDYTVDTTRMYQPRVVQTVSGKEQEASLMQGLAVSFKPEQQTVQRVVTPSESMTPSQIFAYEQSLNQPNIFVTQAEEKARAFGEEARSIQSDTLSGSTFYKTVDGELVKPSPLYTAGVLGAYAGARFVKGATVGTFNVVSPYTTEGKFQVPLVTPAISFGKYLASGEYIKDLVSDPIGTTAEFVGVTKAMESKPILNVISFESKALARPFEIKGTEVRKGTYDLFDSRLFTPAERSASFLADPFRKVGDTTFGIIELTDKGSGQTSLVGLELTQKTFGEKSKEVDVLTYPTKESKPRPVYDESGVLQGYSSVEINSLKKGSSIFEQVGDTGQGKLIEDTVYYKIKDGKFIPTETEPASGVSSLLRKAEAEKQFASSIFDLRVERLSSPKEGEFIIRDIGSGQSSLKGDINRNLGASKVLNPQDQSVLMRVEGEQARLKDYGRQINVNAFDEFGSKKEGTFVDLANTKDLAVIGQRNIFGEVVTPKELAKAREELYGKEIFGAPRKTEGGFIEYPESRVILKEGKENFIIPTGQEKLVQDKLVVGELSSAGRTEKVSVQYGEVFVEGKEFNPKTQTIITESPRRALESNPFDVSVTKVDKQLNLFGEEAKPTRDYTLTTELDTFTRDLLTMVDSTSPKTYSPTLTSKDVVVDNSKFSFTPREELSGGKTQVSSSIYANDKGLSEVRLSDARFDTEVVSNVRVSDVEYIRKTLPTATDSFTDINIGGSPISDITGVTTLNPRIATVNVFDPVSKPIVSTRVSVSQFNVLGLGLSQSLSPSLKTSQSSNVIQQLVPQQRQDQSITSIQKLTQQQDQKQKQESITQQLQGQKQISITQQTYRTVIPTYTITTTGKIGTSTFDTPITPVTPITPTTSVIETFREEPTKPKKPKSKIDRDSDNKKSKFRAVTKRGGKLVFIAGTESESPTTSLSKGVGFVKSTLARSLGVVNVETGRFESTGIMPEGFRTAKRGGNFVIQSNALSSKSETSEIQMAKKSKNVFR